MHGVLISSDRRPRETGSEVDYQSSLTDGCRAGPQTGDYAMSLRASTVQEASKEAYTLWRHGGETMTAWGAWDGNMVL